MKNGRYEEAERELSNALKGLPRRLDIYRELADTQVFLGRVRAAEEILFKGLNLAEASKNERYDGWLQLADILKRQGKHNKALDALNEARKLDSNRLEAIWKIARLYEGFKKYEVARSVYEMAASQSKEKAGEVQALFRWALMEKTAGNTKDSEDLLKKAISLKRGEEKLRFSLYFTLGKLLLERAVEEIESSQGKRSLKLSSKKKSAQREGISLTTSTETTKLLIRAREAFKKATSLNPEEGEAWLLQGRVLTMLGNCNEATLPLEKAIELMPKNGFAPGLLARCLSKKYDETSKNGLGGRKRAYRLALKAHTLSPDDPAIMMLLAELHVENGLEKPALDILNRLAKMKGVGREVRDMPSYWVLHGESLMAAGRHREAVSSFSRAVALSPGDERALRLQALAFARAGLYETAVDALRSVRKTAEKENGSRFVGGRGGMYLEIEIQLAISLEMTQKRTEALRILRNLERKFPQEGVVFAYLGWIYLRDGQKKKALNYAEKAVEMGGDSLLHALDVLAQAQIELGELREAKLTILRAQELTRTKKEKAYFKKLLSRLENSSGADTKDSETKDKKGEKAVKDGNGDCRSENSP